MKQKALVAVLALALTAMAAVMVLAACASTGGKAEPESELVIMGNDWWPYYVYIQDENGNTVFPRTGKNYTIKNENTVVTVPLQNGKYNLFYLSKMSKETGVNPTKVDFELNYQRGLLNFRDLQGRSRTLSVSKVYFNRGIGAVLATVDKAFANIDAVLSATIKQNSTIAVFPVTAVSTDVGEMVLENLTIQFVNSGYTVVEKRRVEELLAEYDFQLSGLVGEKTLGELLGADAVVFSTLSDDGQLSSWAVDTSKRTTLAKSVPVQGKIQKVEYPPPPLHTRDSGPWIAEVSNIASRNPQALFAPKPTWQQYYDGISLIVADREWYTAKRARDPKRDLALFQITGGSNNEAATIQSFLANSGWIQNNYTVYDGSGDSEYAKYAGAFNLGIREQRREIETMTDTAFTGRVQQVSGRNMLILQAYSSTKGWNMSAFEYADSLELWVKMQSAVERFAVKDLGLEAQRRQARAIDSGRREAFVIEEAAQRTASINSQFGTGINRSEAEMLTQLIITDTLSIPLKEFALSSFIDQTSDIAAGERQTGDLQIRLNWSRTGNRNRLEAAIGSNRYVMEYGTQQEFMRKVRGLSFFVLSNFGSSSYQLLGIDGYNTSTAAEPANIPANFTKLSRVGTRQGAPMGGFYISNAPVSQREYEAVMKQNPSWTKNPAQPVNNISIADAMIFCNQMSIRDGLVPAYSIEKTTRMGQTARDTLVLHRVSVDNFATGYRLATTDEWNYARGKIDGVGVLAEYVYDGDFSMSNRRIMDEASYMTVNGKATIGSNEANREFNSPNPVSNSYSDFFKESNGWSYYRISPTIRLIRPIFDYWKYTTGE